MAVPVLKSGPTIVYPESDGEPIAENTKQFEWIVTIEGGLEALFADRDDVFVAADLFWYPVQGDPNTRMAPDALVIFGRPKGHRRSYLQWLEDDIPPQVVFEVLSPGNRAREMAGKRNFYERHGAEEYYLYDPDGGTLAGWLRSGHHLDPILAMEGWVSPRLGIRFGLEGADLVLTRPDGRRFQSFREVVAEWERAEERADQAEERADQAEDRARQAEERAARLAARLRELGLSEEGP